MPEWLRQVLQQMSSESYLQQSLNEPLTSLNESNKESSVTMDDADWMSLADVYQKIMDVVIGYRTSAVSAGFDPSMADHMAAQLHTVMLQKLFAQ